MDYVFMALLGIGALVALCFALFAGACVYMGLKEHEMIGKVCYGAAIIIGHELLGIPGALIGLGAAAVAHFIVFLISSSNKPEADKTKQDQGDKAA